MAQPIDIAIMAPNLATTSTEQPPSSNFIERILTPKVVGLLGLIALLIILTTILDGSKKGKLSNNRFATQAEVNRATKLAKRQIKKGKHNKIGVLLGSNQHLGLPNLQPAVAVVGSSRAGKTRSVLDPALKNAIEQGWSLMVLDVKGNMKKKHLPYARELGYDCYVYAPGKPYSDGLNHLDFLEGPYDAKRAAELAMVVNANNRAPGQTRHEFFGSQGDGLLKADFMLAKGLLSYPDMITAWKILGLPQLGKRFFEAYERGRFDYDAENSIDPWIGEAVTAMRTIANAEETALGVHGTAQTHFQKLVDQSMIQSMSDTTLPLKLMGKQIIFYEMDELAEEVSAPLVASAIHMGVINSLNASTKRDRPLGLFLDELSSIRLPRLEQWISRNAEYGMAAFLGYQSDAQIEMRYSRNEQISILSSCGTKFYFRLGNDQMAKTISSGLGKCEVKIQSTNRSRGKRNSTRGQSEQSTLKDLISAEEINSMDQGECIIRSPGWNNRAYRLRIPLSPIDEAIWAKGEEIWDEHYEPMLTERAQAQLNAEDPLTMLNNREEAVRALLPSREEYQAMDKFAEALASEAAAESKRQEKVGAISG